MKKNYLLLRLILFFTAFNFFSGYSQTTIISPTGDGGFETGATMALNNWTVTTSGTANRWVSGTGAVGYTGARAGYISNDAVTPPTYAYTTSTSNTSHLYRNVTIPAGETDITLSFDWKCKGEDGFDKMWVWAIPTTTTPAYNTKINSLISAGRVRLPDASTEYDFQTTLGWVNASFKLPASYAGTTFRLVFEWQNDSGGVQPPMAIDNITLVSQVPSPPANNECATATSLTVNPTTACAASTAGTTINATQSQVACAGTADDDVWYSFTATSTSHIITVTPTTLADVVFQTFSGACGALTSLGCVNATSGASTETTTISGLTIGAVYKVRVYSSANSSGKGTFSICVTTPIVNDVCSGAINLPISNTCSYTTYSNVGATDSAGVPAPGCGAYVTGDVWFSVVVPANGELSIDTQTGTLSDCSMALYTGTCGALTLLECNEDSSDNGSMPKIVRTGLTPGSTIYIRLWDLNGNDFGNFGICVVSSTCSSPRPLNLIPILTTSTSATVSWDAAVPAPAAGYQYYVSTSNTEPNEATFPTGSVAAGVTTFSISGLTTGTRYYVWVRSNCGGTDGPSNWSVVTYLNTPVGSCAFGSGTGTSTSGCVNVVSGGQGLSGADPAAISCSAASTCVNLEATYANLGTTSSYNVQSIGYAPPYQFSCLKNPVSVNVDDVWSPIVPLPFNFCFYGNTYNKCLIGSNGIITFDRTNNTPGGFSDWKTRADNPGSLPIAGHSALRTNSIFGVFHDLNPSLGGEIGWEYITLNTGCRALVVAWNDVPMFSCTTTLYSGMIVLYENTNIIEVYAKSKNLCTTWNDGNAVVGIQNAAGTLATVVPNKNTNSTDWTATNEAWRFTPSGASALPTIAWYEGATATGPVIGTSATLNVCPTATTTYTSAVTYTLCNGGSFVDTDTATVTVTGAKIWNGTVDTNWNVSNNWTPAGVPTTADCVVIPDTANDPRVIGTNFNGVGLNLTVQNNATLTVTTNNDLSITDRVTINSGGDLILDNSSSLIQTNNVTNTGTMHMSRTANLRKWDYVYWSSPVSAFSVNTVSPGTTGYKYKWIPTIPTNTNGFGNWSAANENMALGKGYIVRGPDSFTTTLAPLTPVFTGTPNNGTINVPIERGVWNGGNYSTGVSTAQATNDDDNWNLIGNPYPSAVNAIGFLTANTNIAGFIKVWTHGTLPSSAIVDPFYNDFVYNYTVSDYITYNAAGTSSGPGFDGNIAAGQGFFVLMNHTSAAASENVIFNNTMRSSTYDNAQFFKNHNEEGRIWLDLIAPDNKVDRNLVAYVNGATNEKDRLYDAKAEVKLNLNLYSVVDEIPMTIQGRVLPFENSDKVAMGAKVPQDGNYSISIGAVDGLFLNANQPIYLEDHVTNVIHNLRQAPYSFTALKGDYPNRFTLRYTPNDLQDDTIDQNDVWLTTQDYLTVVSNKINIESIQVFDVLGRLLTQKNNINTHEYKFSDFNKSTAPVVLIIKLENGKTIKMMSVF